MSKSIQQQSTTTSEQGNSVAGELICANCGEEKPTDHEAIACCVDIKIKIK